MADIVLARASRVEELLACCLVQETEIRSRASHALMTIARRKDDLLQPHTAFLLQKLMTIPQWEVRSHLCQTITLLKLDKEEIDRLVEILAEFLADKSSIVRTCAMQAMVDLCGQSPGLVHMVRPVIADRTISGTAAMRARGRQLLKVLDRDFPN